MKQIGLLLLAAFLSGCGFVSEPVPSVTVSETSTITVSPTPAPTVTITETVRAQPVAIDPMPQPPCTRVDVLSEKDALEIYKNPNSPLGLCISAYNQYEKNLVAWKLRNGYK